MVTDPAGSEPFSEWADEVAEASDSRVEPLTQLVMNSHSPVVLAALEDASPSQVLFVDVVDRVDPAEQSVSHRTRMRQVRRQGELTPAEAREYVTAFEVQNYAARGPSGTSCSSIPTVPATLDGPASSASTRRPRPFET